MSFDLSVADIDIKFRLRVYTVNQLLSRDNTFRSPLFLLYRRYIRIASVVRITTRTRMIHAYIGTSIDEKTIRPRGHVLSMPLNGIVGEVFRDSRPFSSTRRLALRLLRHYYYSPRVPISKSLFSERKKKLRFNNGLFPLDEISTETLSRNHEILNQMFPPLLCLSSSTEWEKTHSWTGRG